MVYKLQQQPKTPIRNLDLTQKPKVAEKIKGIDNDEERLEIVDLGGMSFETVPSPPLNLAHICKLDLSNNNLQIIPESLMEGLLNIVVLDIHSNQLKSLPNSIGCLSKLKVLNVAGNLLLSLPKAIMNCRCLKDLNVNFNKLSRLPDNIGFWLRNLEKLSVNSNLLAFFPSSLTHITSMKKLDARLNKLRSLPEDVGNLIHLEVLNVSQNFQCLEVLPYSIGMLVSLVELDVSYNKIKTLPDSIGCLRSQSACIDWLLKEPENAADEDAHINKGNLNAVGVVHNHNSDVPSLVPVKKAISSICLITIGEGVWASGVLLNEKGLVLTNAHLLEPSRFGRTTASGGGNEIRSDIIPYPLSGEDVLQKNKRKLFNAQEAIVGSSYNNHGIIRVRLNHVDPGIWCDAKVVYISRGPLDVALLQLENVTGHLIPISVDLLCPALGSTAYVIGHALFGPRCGFSPSVCSGVVAKIVRAKAPFYYQVLHEKDLEIPAMLETTAAVYSGGSGGAVVNSDGQMIGLVTSNMRHGRGTIIPHLNFSIPCAALAPIFEFSKDMEDITLLKQLEQSNEDLSSVWSLVPRPGPSLPLPLDTIQESLKKSKKGSQFAKFLVESDKVSRSPAAATQLGVVGSSSNSTNRAIFLSKL